MSRTLSENMPGHAYGRNNYGKSFFIPYRRSRFKSDNGQHTNNINSYLLYFISCDLLYKRIKQQNKKKSNVTVWLIQCHGFENDSNGTVTVYLRHF